MGDADLAAEMQAIDAQVDSWAREAGWPEQLQIIAAMSTGFAEPRLGRPGAAELKMLILRQRNLIDRWVRQAYLEGLIVGLEKQSSNPEADRG